MRLFPASVLMLHVVGCGMTSTSSSSSSSSGSSGPLQVVIPFEAMAGATEFSCANTLSGLGTTNSVVSVRDFRFYIHDLVLTKTDGSGDVPVTLEQDGTWQKDGVALVDFEDGTGTCTDGTPGTHTEVKGTAPAGDYNGIAFKVGVPFSMNHQDTASAPAPLNLTAMWWNWNGGYKFMKVDLSSTGMAGGWLIHLGSTGCTPSGNNVTSCANPNRPAVSLPGFELGHNAVSLDLQALLANSNVDTDTGGAPGCMSGATDPECAPLFGKLGLPINGNGGGAQSVFGMVHHHSN